MSFVYPKQARDYFHACETRKDGGPKFGSMFDHYYLCLLVGLDARQIAEEKDQESGKFVDEYPDDYKNQADMIAGLLIDAELDRKGVQKTDRHSIEQEMLRLLNVQSPTRLSHEGNRILNLYAAAGFKIIRDHIERPQTVEDFIVAYRYYWDQVSEA